jgi:hypothetical protein
MSALWKIKPQLDAPTGGIWLGPGANRPSDGLLLGTVAEIGGVKLPSVWLSTSKEQVVAVVGKRGSGKSFTLGVLAEGLSLSSKADHVARRSLPRAMLLFDPLDVYWTTRFSVRPNSNAEVQSHFALAEKAGLKDLAFDVQAWVPGIQNARAGDPDWFQCLSLPTSALGLDEWELLLGANVANEPMGQALADALTLARNTGFHRNGSAIAPIAQFDLSHLVNAVSADELQVVFHAETLRALRQRLSSLNGTGLFSAVGTSLSQLASPGKLSVVLLSRLSQSYQSALVAVLTRMLIENRSVTAFAEKRLALDSTLIGPERNEVEAIVRKGIPKTVVALDEAQIFLAPGVGGAAKDVFIRLVKEGRNIGLSAAIATQQPSAIDQRILSQVETFIAHQLVTEADIRAVRENIKAVLPESIVFGTRELDFSGLLRTLAPGQCMVSAADMTNQIRRSILVNIRARATIHGGVEL